MRYKMQLPLPEPYLERVFRWMDEGESLDMKWENPLPQLDGGCAAVFGYD